MKNNLLILSLITVLSFNIKSNGQIIPNIRTQPELPSLGSFFDKNRAVCVVLIHGITNTIATSNRLTPQRPVNSLKFARHYWSYDFIQGLFSVGFPGEISPQLWTYSNCNDNGRLNITPNAWDDNYVSNTTASDHILTGSQECPAIDATGPSGVKGFYTVMMTHRDGSLSLKKQTAAAAAQIRQFYNETFGSWQETKRPQLILLCHSGGGLVARAICSKPTGFGGGVSSLGEQAIPVENFTATELSNMEFIRNRTMYIVTLATPHEGAPIAKVTNQIGQHLGSMNFLDKTIIISQDVYDQDPGTAILKELCPNIMLDYNKDQLSPGKCKRSDGSLIPIYCLGGRAAGGPFFYKDPNQYDSEMSTPDGGISFTKNQLKFEAVINGRSNRPEFEAYGLLKADYLTTLLYGIVSLRLDGLGAVTGFDRRFFVATPDNPQLDIVKIRNNGLLGCLDPPVFNLIDFAVGPKLFYLRSNWTDKKNSVGLCTGQYQDNGSLTQGDGLIDCDGFVPIISSLGVNLGTDITNYFGYASSGSWYRFYRSAADYDNHGSIMQRFAVGEFVRKNIIGINYLTNTGGGIKDPAAGPYVSTTGTRSKWTK